MYFTMHSINVTSPPLQIPVRHLVQCNAMQCKCHGIDARFHSARSESRAYIYASGKCSKASSFPVGISHSMLRRHRGIAQAIDVRRLFLSAQQDGCIGRAVVSDSCLRIEQHGYHPSVSCLSSTSCIQDEDPRVEAKSDCDFSIRLGLCYAIFTYDAIPRVLSLMLKADEIASDFSRHAYKEGKTVNCQTLGSNRGYVFIYGYFIIVVHPSIE